MLVRRVQLRYFAPPTHSLLALIMGNKAHFYNENSCQRNQIPLNEHDKDARIRLLLDLDKFALHQPLKNGSAIVIGQIFAASSLGMRHHSEDVFS